MINVIDSHCGSGKSQSMIALMNEAPKEERFIYVTPFLKECERIRKSCPGKHFKEPDEKAGKGSKQRHLQELIEKNDNIVCTHALFSLITRETIDLLKDRPYTLILDEVLDVVEKYDILDGEDFTDEEKRDYADLDIKRFINTGQIQIAENGMLFINENDTLLSKYKSFEDDIKKECLYLNLKEENNSPVKVFPPIIFNGDLFKDIYILTYQFESQKLFYYFQFFNIEYEQYYATKDTEDNFIILPATNDDFMSQDSQWRESIKQYIHVHQDNGKKKYNEVGNDYYALSANWYKKNLETEKFIALSVSLNSFFRKTPANKRMWTCFKAYQQKPNKFKKALKKQRNSNNINLGKDIENFVSVNAKAINKYDNKTHLAYLVNRFYDPIITNFFNLNGISLKKENIERMALADLIQWIWRSAIRKSEPEEIYIYIPSSRMRDLFCRWLNNEIF
ncbi:DEAD/DEAH box helicase family protein [Eubacterium callanderi]|uniref:DEAD/DEAH box helicase family protein n=1 Tax=Eubacterium callanderi TaxID=53442 RepID=UPI001C107CC6|nr:DEAD/DEAH box helicase family protein [Eubacterium callanderi]MBU5302126.1 DEAD/DEAH box helicase family protein [Eubacterium callanderi]